MPVAKREVKEEKKVEEVEEVKAEEVAQPAPVKAEAPQPASKSPSKEEEKPAEEKIPTQHVKMGGVKISLNRYLALKQVRPEHRRGMKAFTSVEKTTLQEWEKIFSKY